MRPKLIVRVKPRGRRISARDKLVLEHLAWAREIAERVAAQLPTWFTADDLIGPVELALVKLAESYDPDRGVPFRAYALSRLRGACFDAVRRREYRERGHASLDEYHAVKGEGVHSGRYDGDDRVNDRWLADTQSPSPEQQTAANELKAIWFHVWRLPPRHARVIQRFYGDGVTLHDLAPEFGVCESRLSQLHTEALVMLRALVETMR